MNRLALWREALVARLTAEGRFPWSGAPKAHPYIEYHPTNPPRRRSSRVAASPAPLSASELRRAIKRAYENEHLVPWAPMWMHAALFFEGDTELPKHLQGLSPLVTRHRYATPDEPVALDAIARISGTVGVLSFIHHRRAELRQLHRAGLLQELP